MLLKSFFLLLANREFLMTMFLQTIVSGFGKRAEPEGLEGQDTTCRSTMTDIALAGFRDKYSIPDEYVLLCPGPDGRACSPPTRVLHCV